MFKKETISVSSPRPYNLYEICNAEENLDFYAVENNLCVVVKNRMFKKNWISQVAATDLEGNDVNIDPVIYMVH